VDLQLAPALVVAQPPFGFRVDGAGKFGMMRHNSAKIRQIKNQQRGVLGSGDVRRADQIAKQGELAEKSADAQPDGRRFDIRFIPGSPRGRNFEIIRELARSAA